MLGHNVIRIHSRFRFDHIYLESLLTLDPASKSTAPPHPPTMHVFLAPAFHEAPAPLHRIPYQISSFSPLVSHRIIMIIESKE
jgi:hypothetical protein